MNRKRIALVTGTRADFGAVGAIYKALASIEQFDPVLYITGMHLLERFGTTVDEIVNGGIRTYKTVQMYDDTSDLKSENLMCYVDSISKAVRGFGDAFSKDKPDLVILTGDRIEMLAACVAAAVLKLPIAHVHGGDSAWSGQIDEQIRHAITKFSHLHFAATDLSKKRILQMGEEEWRVFNTGSPNLDSMREENLLEKNELIRNLGLENKLNVSDPMVLCVFHPPILNHVYSGKYAREMFECLKRLDLHVISIYPNNDPGSELIIQELVRLENEPKFHVYRNLSRKVYLSLMKHAMFMIGNSSSGIIESAFFHLPVVNIGDRNLDREASDNVINVKQDIESIWKGILLATSKDFIEKCSRVENKYGDGTAGKKIAAILQKFQDFGSLLKKDFVIR
ncbi:MAG: UDP-N-acetylglucosamine 2-epimerase [Candidatus Sigynarchaeota archaeon]